MNKNKPPAVPMTKCALCCCAIEETKVEAHTREHVVLKHEDPPHTGGAFRQDDAGRPRRTIIYEIRALLDEKRGQVMVSTEVFAHALAKIYADLPPDAHVQCVPTEHVTGKHAGIPTALMTCMMVIIRL